MQTARLANGSSTPAKHCQFACVSCQRKWGVIPLMRIVYLRSDCAFVPSNMELHCPLITPLTMYVYPIAHLNGQCMYLFNLLKTVSLLLQLRQVERDTTSRHMRTVYSTRSASEFEKPGLRVTPSADLALWPYVISSLIGNGALALTSVCASAQGAL